MYKTWHSLFAQCKAAASQTSSEGEPLSAVQEVQGSHRRGADAEMVDMLTSCRVICSQQRLTSSKPSTKYCNSSEH